MIKKILICLLIVSINQFSKAQEPGIHHWESLLFPEAPLKYIIPLQEPDPNWKNPGFDDASWTDFINALGSGDAIDILVNYADFPELPLSNSASIYTRTRFTIADTAAIEKLMLDIYHEDGMVAYINGVEVARKNMGNPGEATTFNQLADTCLYNDVDFYFGSFKPGIIVPKTKLKECLKTGDNILAIELHNDAIHPEALSMVNFVFAGMKSDGITYGPMAMYFPVKVELDSTLLPIVEINSTEYGQLIGDQEKMSQIMKIIDNPGEVYNKPGDNALDYHGNIGIEFRGSSSLFQFPQKSYTIETRDLNGDNLNVSILGMPEENDWVLYAPYGDRTLMRNVLTYDLARSFGEIYAPRTKFVELIRDGSLMGVYVLTEKIKQDKGRVDISTLRPDEIAGDSLTGGYILKIDKREGNFDGFFSEFGTSTNDRKHTYFQYVYPKYDEIVDEQKAYIENFMYDFESSLRDEQFDDEVSGYKRFIDVSSFIDFLIINELNKNVDGYRISTFMYKDRDDDNGKLHMGPVWDFNLAYGNADYCQGDWIEGWSFDYNLVCNDANEPPFWWDRLLQDSAFVEKLVARWDELRATKLDLDSINFKIDSLSDYLGDARLRNFAIWQDVFTEYIWPHEPAAGNSYESEISYMKNWIADRVDWIDNNISTVRERKIYVGIDNPKLDQEYMPFVVFPNPFTDVANFNIELEQEHHLQVKVYSITGQMLATIVDEDLSKGHYNFEWNGSTLSGETIESGAYIYTILVDGKIVYNGKLLKQ